ncbi:hypothetical protein M4D51_05855 [Microbacterium sp. p3-SID338]|uniref:hypothetical protein n=1 Tax=unclassified Microbacterium TaxID=2609290 RepID=UPI000786EDAF|nr:MULTISPECIES: hypothetical protein [unclassified Microbacterium]KYJ97844.1 hypothetical protein AUV07_16830 [Microbacterium sp. CH1]MCT1395245.1 hypothetical protein [Microbacterium sp. p3-SID338]PMC03818.1 hypothetical protein CJ226_07210 [Microbacterium sp. UMB0228]
MNRRDVDDSRFSAHERKASRRYLLEMIPGLALMLGSLAVLMQAPSETSDAVLQTVAAVVAMGGAGWVVVAVWRHLRRAAEYEKRALLVTFSVSFAATTLTAFGFGLASLVGAQVAASEWLILSAGLMTWCIAGVVTTRR